MNKVRICNKDYNVSKRVYYHIQGLETENRLFSNEIKGHEKNEISLQQENKQLKERIDKARTYIEMCWNTPDIDGYTSFDLSKEETEELLEILKGDE